MNVPCEGMTSEFFADEESEYADLAWPEACSACPVRLECLATALRAGEPHGVWGGFTPRARINLLALMATGAITWATVEQSLRPNEGVLRWQDD